MDLPFSLYSVWILVQISHIHGHLSDLGLVKLLDIPEVPHISFREEFDCYTLPTKSTNRVNIILVIFWKIKVNHKSHLLHINTMS